VDLSLNTTTKLIAKNATENYLEEVKCVDSSQSEEIQLNDIRYKPIDLLDFVLSTST